MENTQATLPCFMNREKVLERISRRENKWKRQNVICENKRKTMRDGTWETSTKVRRDPGNTRYTNCVCR